MRGTTICCSAVALTLLSFGGAAPDLKGRAHTDSPDLKGRAHVKARANGAASQPSAPAEPPGLFPIRARWTIALNNVLTTHPAYDGVRGYFPIEGDRLVAYDFAAGEQLWLVAAHPTVQPAAGAGLLFVPHRDAVVALDAATGSERWRHSIAEPLSGPPVFDNGWLIAAERSGTILALRAGDGRLMWQRDMGSRATGSPALTADRLYVPLADRRVIALGLEDGAPIWQRKVGGEPTGLLALEDRIYAGATDNFLYCFDAKTGETDWRWRTGGDIVGAPVADADRVYFVSLDNILRGLTRTGGTQQWKRALPLRPRSAPLLAGDTVVVGGLSPTLRAYSIRNGAPAGEVPLGADLVAPLHLVSGEAQQILVAVTGDIVKGATVAGFSRALEPAVAPLAPLPNPTPPPAPPVP